MSGKIPATLIPGDGIGPEIVKSCRAFSTRLARRSSGTCSRAAWRPSRKAGDPLPQATLDSIRRTRLALKGPLTTPVGGGFRSINVRLREEFGLYANVRPVRSMVPGGRFDDIDIVLVRENLERSLCGLRALHPDRRRSARRCDLDRGQHPRGIAHDYRIRIRLCAQERAQEGYRCAQGQRAEGIDRRVSRSRPRGREEIRGQGRRWTIASSTPPRCSS